MNEELNIEEIDEKMKIIDDNIAIIMLNLSNIKQDEK